MNNLSPESEFVETRTVVCRVLFVDPSNVKSPKPRFSETTSPFSSVSSIESTTPIVPVIV